MEAQSEHVHVAYTRFCTFGTDLHAQSVPINKNFRIGAQSEVYQECVVGWVVVLLNGFPFPPPLPPSWVGVNGWGGGGGGRLAAAQT